MNISNSSSCLEIRRYTFSGRLICLTDTLCGADATHAKAKNRKMFSLCRQVAKITLSKILCLSTFKLILHYIFTKLKHFLFLIEPYSIYLGYPLYFHNETIKIREKQILLISWHDKLASNRKRKLYSS